MAFPLLRLGMLFIRHAVKPIANGIMAKARSSDKFKRYICMPPSRAYNWIEVKIKGWTLNLGKPVTVTPLTEATAIELGANILGESIIFAVSAYVLIVEYSRQSANETKRQEVAVIEKAELFATLTEIRFRLKHQDAQLREMKRIFGNFGRSIPTKSYKRSTAAENEKLKTKVNEIKISISQSLKQI